MIPVSSRRGIAAMIAASGALVSNDACMKAVMADAPPLQVLFMRGVAASLWCLSLLLILGHGRKLHMMGNRWNLLRCLFEVMAVSCFILALKHMPIADITAIIQTAPLLVLIGASLIWGERIGGVRAGLIGLGIVGALLVAQPGGTAASPFALLGFVSAMSAAGRDLISSKVPHDVPGLIVAFSTILGVLVAASILTMSFESWVPPTSNHLLLMALAGLFLVFGQLFIFLAFRWAQARTIAPFYYSFTLWAVMIGFFGFGDAPNGLALSGIGLILFTGLAVAMLEGWKGGKTAITSK